MRAGKVSATYTPISKEEAVPQPEECASFQKENLHVGNGGRPGMGAVAPGVGTSWGWRTLVAAAGALAVIDMSGIALPDSECRTRSE